MLEVHKAKDIAIQSVQQQLILELLKNVRNFIIHQLKLHLRIMLKL